MAGNMAHPRGGVHLWYMTTTHKIGIGAVILLGVFFTGYYLGGKTPDTPVVSYAAKLDSIELAHKRQLDSLQQIIDQANDAIASIQDKPPVTIRVRDAARGLSNASVDSLAGVLWADPR